MSSQDVEYYRERARTERALADACGHSRIAEIHEALAMQYEALVAKLETTSAGRDIKG